MSKLISVVIPVYNHASQLRKSLASLSLQTHQELDVVIVNDGSTDNFEDEIRSLTTKFSLRVINQNNAGAGAARNRGYQEVKGDYVIFWDADTMAKPEMLKKMLDALLSNPKASYAFSKFKLGWKKFSCGKFNSYKLRQNNYIDTVSLIKRADFPATGWDEQLKRFQDWDLWLTMLAEKKSGIFIPTVLYSKIIGKRKGISVWLPSFFYRIFENSAAVKQYQQAKQIVLKKHGL